MKALFDTRSATAGHAALRTIPLRLLESHQRTVGEIVGKFKLSQPTISRHLSVLKEADLVVAAAGIAMLVIGSRLFVDASVTIAALIGVPTAVVGLSAAAFGSSLPELTASIIAARHGQPEMAAGNLIGSNIFNLLLILGATSLFQPLSMGSVTIIDLGVMIGVSALALTLMLTRARLHRPEGIALVAVYGIYMTWLFAH